MLKGKVGWIVVIIIMGISLLAWVVFIKFILKGIELIGL
jgi:hypothetical protein